MADNKYTLQEVADYVAGEGLGYAVMDGIDGSNTDDAKLAQLWTEAAKAMSALHNYLEPFVEER